jgi:hypothetical protein
MRMYKRSQDKRSRVDKYEQTSNIHDSPFTKIKSMGRKNNGIIESSLHDLLQVVSRANRCVVLIDICPLVWRTNVKLADSFHLTWKRSCNFYLTERSLIVSTHHRHAELITTCVLTNTASSLPQRTSFRAHYLDHSPAPALRSYRRIGSTFLPHLSNRYLPVSKQELRAALTQLRLDMCCSTCGDVLVEKSRHVDDQLRNALRKLVNGIERLDIKDWMNEENLRKIGGSFLGIKSMYRRKFRAPGRPYCVVWGGFTTEMLPKPEMTLEMLLDVDIGELS